MKKYIYFWGCQIPARFPFMEKAARVILEKLGIMAEDISGFTCCPEKNMAQNMGDDIWLLTAIRNLALAETAGGEALITPCNGCYATFKSAAHKLSINPPLAIRINKVLQDSGLKYSGRMQVKHIIELLADDIGADVLSRKLSNPLWGMKIAVHYGCHLLRPGEGGGFENPHAPVKLEMLVNALGAGCVDYPSKLFCCGESLGRGCDPSQALDMARRKLL